MGRASGPALGVATGAIAVVCCAGGPAIGALLGGITIAAAIGVAGGLALTALLSGAILLIRARSRRGSCPPTTRGRIE